MKDAAAASTAVGASLDGPFNASNFQSAVDNLLSLAKQAQDYVSSRGVFFVLLREWLIDRSIR